ncbi:hypothetical protein GpartN1_g3187.t1 [Galdieria partita]|uniref:Calcineurin-like phosphoesterase domain-containing protein n=1 Tax=Galdieria partita TaxID=83374 RepID=A0A9C7UQ86_9RHOD|nr:hypothetical protein GpartN1_g3187.t1 [Galdieria partita]
MHDIHTLPISYSLCFIATSNNCFKNNRQTQLHPKITTQFLTTKQPVFGNFVRRPKRELLFVRMTETSNHHSSTGHTTAQSEQPCEMKVFRLIHWTDVHFHVLQLPTLLPTWKQLLGLAHLYVKGRRHDFRAAELVPTMVSQIDTLQPDLCIFSGDLTGLGLPAEFEIAKSILSPMLEKYPNIMIAGNHDRYTKNSEYLMEQYFGEYMKGGDVWENGKWKVTQETPWPRVYDAGFGLKVIALDQARPSKWSFGENSAPQLERLEMLLERLDSSRCIVVGHYPVLNIDGSISDSFGRSLKDVHELYQVFCRQPPLAYLCGHDHEHYMQSVLMNGRMVRFLCCGSTSYLGNKPQKKAGFYEVKMGMAMDNPIDDTNEWKVLSVTRYEWNSNHRQFECLDGPPILYRPNPYWVIAHNG